MQNLQQQAVNILHNWQTFVAGFSLATFLYGASGLILFRITLGKYRDYKIFRDDTIAGDIDRDKNLALTEQRLGAIDDRNVGVESFSRRVNTFIDQMDFIEREGERRDKQIVALDERIQEALDTWIDRCERWRCEAKPYDGEDRRKRD